VGPQADPQPRPVGVGILSALRISPPAARAIAAAWSALVARLRPPSMVDEHGDAWTAARIGAEFVIIATLMGTPFMLWGLFA